MNKILIFNSPEDDRKMLERTINARLNAINMESAEYLFFEPEDVYIKPMPGDALAVFFLIYDMKCLEAARHFSKLRKKVSVVTVSDSDEYAIESINFGTVDYLLRPFTENRIDAALVRSAKGNLRKQYL